MTNAPTCASPARWTRRSATWRSSSRRWCGATACRRPRVPNWSSHPARSAPPTSFPTSRRICRAAEQRPDLAAGLGVIVFDGPQGRGFYKGGHDGQTANSFVCLERGRRCVLLLANDVRAEARFADLVRLRARRHRRPVRLGIRRSGGQVLTAAANQRERARRDVRAQATDAAGNSGADAGRAACREAGRNDRDWGESRRPPAGTATRFAAPPLDRRSRPGGRAGSRRRPRQA